ncbi:hypothetical protein NQD34_008667 [Periophthalmus magnuspinnatus]|nr:hypothetical protein NQD34_008667 [Periophthalmus magnuspinnatus]
MEPGIVLDSSVGFSGCTQSAGVREETPGEEAKGGEGSTAMSKLREEDSPAAEETRVAGEEDGETRGNAEDEGKYEEELDPRIQA